MHAVFRVCDVSFDVDVFAVVDSTTLILLFVVYFII